MNIKDLINLLKEDLNRWDSSIIKLYFTKAEFRLVWRYRWCNFFSNKKMLIIFYIFERIIYHLTCIRCGCDIPSKVKIGGGFKILHSWGIVINSKAKIGKNFTIISGTIIGKNNKGVPTIGNNVFVGARSIIIGDIKIGDDSIIGAGAIITRNVENGSIMCNEKARCIKKVRK